MFARTIQRPLPLFHGAGVVLGSGLDCFPCFKVGQPPIVQAVNFDGWWKLKF